MKWSFIYGVAQLQLLILRREVEAKCATSSKSGIYWHDGWNRLLASFVEKPVKRFRQEANQPCFQQSQSNKVPSGAVDIH